LKRNYVEINTRPSSSRVVFACIVAAPIWLLGCGSDTDPGSPAKPVHPHDSGSGPDAKPVQDSGSPHRDAGLADSSFRPDSSDSPTHGGGPGDGGDASLEPPPPPPPPNDGDASPDAAPDSGTIPIPTLVSSDPASGAADVPRSTWIRLQFSASLPAEVADTVRLDCGTGTPEIDVDRVGATTLVVNPRAQLLPSAACTVSFAVLGEPGHVAFTVATTGEPAVVAYDRNDTTVLDPFPDDYYLVADPTTRTGLRADIRTPSGLGANLTALFDGVLAPTHALDGMSPLAPIVVMVPATLALDSLPTTTADSLNPFASVGLFDIDPASATHGQRIPFELFMKDGLNADGTPSHALVVFPSIALRPRGHYAFALTNRAVVNGHRPLEASAFFRKVAAKLSSTDDEKRLEPALSTVLSELQKVSPPLRTDDLALSLGITVRSVDDIPRDMLSIRETIQNAPAPAFTITSAVPDADPSTDIAAIVTGTWTPLSFTTDGKFLARSADGNPAASPGEPIPFILALPKRTDGHAAPLVIYQHGQPGSAEAELAYHARSELAHEGFAVIGFTDFADRNVVPATGTSEERSAALSTDVLVTLATKQRLPDYLNVFTHAEQLSLLRMIPTLGSIDVLPLDGPDGKPDVDPLQPLGYFGVGQGSIVGASLVAFAPEIHAAVLSTGAGRFSAQLFSSQAETLYVGISNIFPNYTWAESYAGLALLQMDYDEQESQNLFPYVYQKPLPLGSSARASILMTEGLGDISSPSYDTRCGAAALGIPLLAPPAEEVSFLKSVVAPAQANIDPSTSAALVQFAPRGYPLVTRSCARAGWTDGRLCAQASAEAVAQRVAFLKSALAGTPTIPFPF
jgi:hypothetical protein